MKIGIITLNGYYNYGNRLQNYALQHILEQNGHSVKTIWYQQLGKETKKPFILKRIFNKLKGQKISALEKERFLKFKEFSNKYIHETSYKINRFDIPQQLDKEYDVFIAGSDQIWNPHYQNDSNVSPAIEYLTFANQSKRLSYAASFGVDSIPKEFEARAKKGLNEMASILVRETQGKEIVKTLTGREATVVLDPTLLLNQEDWQLIKKEHPYKPTKKYILTYFLGDLRTQHKELVLKLAKERDLDIVNLDDLESAQYYNANPGEFIDFIEGADLFLTDSFHGIVFSTIFETPFIVFKRQSAGPSMYSRIESILNLLGIEGREFATANEKDYFTMDFKEIKNKLSTEQNNSKKSLLESLQVNKNQH